MPAFKAKDTKVLELANQAISQFCKETGVMEPTAGYANILRRELIHILLQQDAATKAAILADATGGDADSYPTLTQTINNCQGGLV